MKTYFVVVCLALSGCIVVESNTCADGLYNGNESDVDCGGSCATCATGRACLSNFDCASGFCNNRICSTTTTASCTDGVLNGTETDVDCGGASCPACLPGRFCAVAADCTSQLCQSQRCAMPATSDLPAVATLYNVDAAAATVIADGSQPGYGITANTGGSFRLVWTGNGGATSYSEFYGSVWTTGTFVSMTPGCAGNSCPLESSSDYVSVPYSVRGGQRIDFDSFARDGVDGFDFVVSTEPAYFDLYIDGQRYPTLVFFTSGGVVSNTASLPFGLSIQ